MSQSANKRIARNSLLLSIRMVIVLIISLYTTRIVLNALGIEDYGINNVVAGFVSMFAFLNTSLSNGIQRFYNYELGKSGVLGANKVYCHSLIIQILLALIIIILAESVGLWYLHTKMVIPEERFIAAQWIFQFSIINLTFVILQAPYNACIIAHERLDYFAFLGIIDAILKLIIVLILPFLNGDLLILYGLLSLSITLLNFTLSYIYCKKKFVEIKWRKTFEKSRFSSMLKFSGWNIFGTLSNMMRDQGINLVLNLFFGPIINAAKGIASQVNSVLLNFISNIQTPMRPQVVQNYAKGNIERSINLMYSASKLSSIFFLFMLIPLSFEIQYILKLWLGSNIPQYAAIFTIIILYNSLVNLLNASTSMIVHASGIMKNYQLCGSLTKLIALPLTYFALQNGKSPIVAFLIVFIFDTLGHIICLFIVRKIINISLFDYFKKAIIPIIILMITVMPFSYLIISVLDESLFRLAISIITSTIILIFSSYYFVLNKNEQAMVTKIISNVSSRIFKK